MKLVSTFLGQPPARRGLLLEALFRLLLVRVRLAAQPDWPSRGFEAASLSVPNQPDSLGLAAGVVAAIEAVSARLPFHATCLIQALAAQRMLRRRGLVADLHLGASPTRNPPLFHAWLVYNGTVILGDRADLVRFEPLARNP